MTQDTSKRLHEINHPYYISPTEGDEAEFQTWDDFLEAWGDADDDYNLLYRFDAHEINDYHGGEHLADEGATHYINIAFVQQRKSRLCVVQAGYTEADEPRIREYLARKYEYILKLWTPFSPAEIQENAR